MSDGEEKPRIVVRDRRAFARDGSRRETPEAPASSPPEVPSGTSSEPAPKPRPAAAPPSPKLESAGTPSLDGPSLQEEPRFRQLVSLLFSQAAALLEREPRTAGRTSGKTAGETADAAGSEVLAGLQMVIGLFEVLEEKTRGRLAPGDVRLLSQMLYQLRLAYMERARPPAPSRPPSA